MYVLDQFALYMTAAADGQLSDIALVQGLVGGPAAVKSSIQKLLINRLAVAQLGNGKGNHGGNGQSQQLLIGGCHLHNQYSACNGGTDGAGEKGCHGNDYNVGSVDGLNCSYCNEYIGADAAA